MYPRTRKRRASFLPRVARTSAATVMSLLISSPHQDWQVRSILSHCAWVAARKIIPCLDANRLGAYTFSGLCDGRRNRLPHPLGKPLIQRGGAGGFACRFRGFPKTFKHPPQSSHRCSLDASTIIIEY